MITVSRYSKDLDNYFFQNEELKEKEKLLFKL